MASNTDEREKDTDTLIAIAGVVIALAVLFGFFGDQMAYTLLMIAKWHLVPTALFYPPHAEALASLGRVDLDDAARIGIAGALGIAADAMRVYAIALALPLIGFGVTYIRKDPRRYRGKHNAMTLLERNARIWPAMQPIVGLDLLKAPREKGPWRVADDYIRLALREGMIERRVGEALVGPRAEGKPPIPVEKAPSVNPGAKGKLEHDDFVPVYRIKRAANGKRKATRIDHASRYPRDAVNAEDFRLNRDTTTAVLINQLGDPLYNEGRFSLRGWKRWPAQHRALLAALLPIAFGPGSRVGRNFGLAQFKQYNAGFYYPDYRKTGKPAIALDDLDMRGVNAILRTYLGIGYGKDEAADSPVPDGRSIPKPDGGAKAVRAFMRQHAFLNVAMLAILLHARRRGTLITPDFIWLRPIDRTLFYTLNSAGRQNNNHATPFPEACGVFSHYFVEDTMGQAILVPDVRTAVKGLHDDLVGEGWLVDTPRTAASKEYI